MYMISSEEFDLLRFNQRMGIECDPVQISAALMLLGETPPRPDMDGRLFLFRHLKGRVALDAKHVASFTSVFIGSGILIEFPAEFEEYNRNIVDHVYDNYYVCEDQRESFTNYRPFMRYYCGHLGVVDEPKRSSIEKILYTD